MSHARATRHSGAEASILVGVAAMTLHAKQMDVLSGRSFEQSVASRAGDRHTPRSGRQTRPPTQSWLVISCRRPDTPTAYAPGRQGAIRGAGRAADARG